MTNDRLAYSPVEFAAQTGLCLNTVYAYIKKGQLRCVKLERRILISREAADAFLSGSQEQQKTSLFKRITGG